MGHVSVSRLQSQLSRKNLAGTAFFNPIFWTLTEQRAVSGYITRVFLAHSTLLR